jgi:hypothetical protein
MDDAAIVVLVQLLPAKQIQRSLLDSLGIDHGAMPLSRLVRGEINRKGQLTVGSGLITRHGPERRQTQVRLVLWRCI